MTLLRGMERIMGLTPEAWRRHANPWSVWTRYSILPLFALAVWSRAWIGPWAWAAVAAVLVWTRINPHLFPVPRDLNNWASKAVMGERVWMNRAAVPIPRSDRAWALGLSVLAGLGLPAFAWGLWALDLGWVVAGSAVILIGKSWFLDRMALLFDRMSDQPPYCDWR